MIAVAANTPRLARPRRCGGLGRSARGEPGDPSGSAARALLVLAVALAGTATAGAGDGRRAAACAPVRTEPGYADAVYGALHERRDVWGDELIRSPEGPTDEGVRRRLHPLLLVGRPAGLAPTRLTDSGVYYYLPFGQSRGAAGAGDVQLHVADGSQISSEVMNGTRMTIGVGAGAGGDERYGSARPARNEGPDRVPPLRAG
jgi:hypothetical protein